MLSVCVVGGVFGSGVGGERIMRLRGGAKYL